MANKLSKELEELIDLLNERRVDLESAICIVLSLQDNKIAQNSLIEWLKNNNQASTDEIMEYVF